MGKGQIREVSVKPHEREPTPIVHTAAVAGSIIAEGRLVPYLILDTRNRPDFEHLVDAHEELRSGDVDTTWAFMPKNKRSISLVLEFKKPSPLFMRLEFGITEWGGLVDQIMATKLVYLQPGKPGDGMDPLGRAPKVLVEVLSKVFQEEWDGILRTELTKDFRKRGLPKKKATKAADELISTWRQFGGFRLPHN